MKKKGENVMDKRQEAKELLKEYKQEHINRFIDEIGDEKAEELIEQIHTIDFHQITELYNNTKKTIEFKESKIEPLKYLDKAKLTFEQTQRFDELGSNVVKKGQYAVVTMAGGQGTRLGHNGPKGTFKLDVYGKGKYLFEILVDNLKEANQKYGITINWYIMTSKENNSATVEFLEKNNYFGYDKNFVKIFTQSEMPLIDTEGKLLMGKDYKIREASDGNGGTYSSLRRSGCLADMKEKGIKNLIIDFGGVLIDLDRQRCIENFAKLGMSNVEAMLDVCHQQGFFLQHEKGLITSAEFRNAIREQIGKVVTDARIDAAWNSFLGSIPTYKLDLLLKLREKYVVYLLSNTNEIHWKWSCKHAFHYKAFRVEDYFERIFLSYEMKMVKPDVAIFEKLLEETGIDPKETFFIDDSTENCRVAETLGISTYKPKACEDWSHLFK